MFGFGRKKQISIADQMETIKPMAERLADHISNGVPLTSVPPQPVKNAEHSRRMSSALGDIVSVFAQSPTHDHLTLRDLGPMILPALGAGQYKVALGRDERTGFSRPIATVLWARVSDDMDITMQADPNMSARLVPDAWTGGSKVWIVEAVGQPTAISALTAELKKTAWNGQDVKYRTAAADGTPTFGVL